MLTTNTDTLFTLIASADADGKIVFVAPERRTLRSKDHARDYLAAMFMELPTANLRLDAVKKAITEIDLEMTPVESGTMLTLNLAKLLLLPAVTPSVELVEFREMLLEMKTFFEAHETERCSIQICNERDRNRRRYGSIACRVPAGENKMKPDEDATARLKLRIEASPALSHWLRQVALTLGKIGPWSWTHIRENELFGYAQGPYRSWRAKQPRVESTPDAGPFKELKLD
jgi:hypothetical protein